MKATLLACALLLGIAVHILPTLGWAASMEEVVLKNGKSYRVLTENGIPMPFKSREIEVMALGPLFSSTGKLQWAFRAKLNERGTFTVTATTPLDTQVSSTFECVGPGEITQILFANDEYPKLWEWYEDPSASWVPIVFTFKNNESGSTFQATQWTKFDASVKVLIKQKLKELRASHGQ
jgi:hypothetical protein